jgi:hypothetical protein
MEKIGQNLVSKLQKLHFVLFKWPEFGKILESCTISNIFVIWPFLLE